MIILVLTFLVTIASSRAVSTLSFNAFILIDVLFLDISVCCLYVCFCVVFATSRRELYVSAGGQKLQERRPKDFYEHLTLSGKQGKYNLGSSLLPTHF